MQGGDGNGFSFVLIKLQWHCVVCLHSAERDKSKVMQLSPRDSFLQAAPRTENGGKHPSFSIYMTLINCSELPFSYCCCLLQPSENTAQKSMFNVAAA